MNIQKSNLRILMAKTNIKFIEDLSKKVHLSVPTLRKIADGEPSSLASVKLGTYISLANFFNCSLNDLIEIK